MIFLKENPAVSIVIPMYNVERYIAQCLESILVQTFQDFEVIVVDDCSTDNSFTLAESFIPKFGGQMTLLKLEKNTGCEGSAPRNVGLKYSRGEYVFFVDADDFLVETALEILYTAATQYSADIVYTSHYYFHSAEGKMQEVVDKESLDNDKMILTVDDTEKLCGQLFTEKGIYHMPWTKFVTRKFLLENEIEFPIIIAGSDFIWTIQVVYYAKRFLRLPIALYFHNENADSVTRKKDIPEKKIVDTVKAFLMGAKALQDLSNKIDVLKRNRGYLLFATGIFCGNCLARNAEARRKFSSVELYEILCNGLEDNSLVPYLFTLIDAQEKDLLTSQKLLIELKRRNDLNGISQNV